MKRGTEWGGGGGGGRWGQERIQTPKANKQTNNEEDATQLTSNVSSSVATPEASMAATSAVSCLMVNMGCWRTGSDFGFGISLGVCCLTPFLPGVGLPDRGIDFLTASIQASLSGLLVAFRR